jgi:hypothetical protein
MSCTDTMQSYHLNMNILLWLISAFVGRRNIVNIYLSRLQYFGWMYSYSIADDMKLYNIFVTKSINKDVE